MQPPWPQAPITPSASPAPASGPKPFFPAPYRIADDSPPLKRQRCVSTPRQARASSSATPDDINIGREREASAMRMFDIWSQLADKYSRRIDEDDIVDLVTGEIVKDRGVLSAETPWKIGRFADMDDSTGSDEDDEDDIDELDAFAASEAKEEVSVHGWTVPPVRKMDPADAKDLEEFMEAENRRREECGDEEASEEDGDVDENQEADFGDDSRDTDASELVQTPEFVPPVSHKVDVDESDDELVSWDVLDASNMIYAVEKTTDNQEIIEILDSPSVSPTRSYTASKTTTPKPKAPSYRKTSPKSQPDRKPHPRLQLQTPPQSRTPSSVVSADDLAIPSAPPPSSPLPSPPSSSPTKPRPNTTMKRENRSAPQARTRSQSRARSSRPDKNESQAPIPRLDLAEMNRGRSVLKKTRARSKGGQSVERQPEASTSSTVMEDLTKHSRRPNTDHSPSKLPLPSTPEPKFRALGKGKEKRATGDKSPGTPNRKGKGRLTEGERPLTNDDRWREESNDPIGLSSSPTRPGRHEERSPEPVLQSTRKRKRKSLSSDGEHFNRAGGSTHASFLHPPGSGSTAKNKTRSSSVSAKFKSKRAAEETSHSDSHSEPESESRRASSPRRPPMSDAIPPYYQVPPGSFYPYPLMPPYTPGTDVHPVMPLQDPRAQFIISQAMQQAMHQLSTLFTAPWSAQPFTPPRHPSSARSASASLSSPYSYPTTPHHPHAHPYVFDSGASVGTLPPSSPLGSSPSSLASSPILGASRRASLVPRSRSRGRRVSFRLDEEFRDEEAGSSLDLLTARGRVRHEELDDTRAASSAVKRKQKDKGKQKMVDVNFSDSAASDAGSEPLLTARPRIAERAQTPGPPIARPDVETSSTVARADSNQRRSAGHSNSTALNPRGKTRKPI